MNTYIYAAPVTDGVPEDPRAGNPSLIEALADKGDSTAQVSVQGLSIYVQTALSEIDSDSAFASWDWAGVALLRAKRRKTGEIDLKTEELATAFPYAGQVFSVAGEQRIELLALLAMSTAAVVTSAPWTSISWPSRDGAGVTIATAIDGIAFASAAFAEVEAIKSAGNVLKAEVEALATVALVNAWVDPR